jgi:hypothetical protein
VSICSVSERNDAGFLEVRYCDQEMRQ